MDSEYVEDGIAIVAPICLDGKKACAGGDEIAILP